MIKILTKSNIFKFSPKEVYQCRDFIKIFVIRDFVIFYKPIILDYLIDSVKRLLKGELAKGNQSYHSFISKIFFTKYNMKLFITCLK